MMCASSQIRNGTLRDNCTNQTIGAMCSYDCDTGYQSTVSKVTCGSELMWEPIDACAGETQYACVRSVCLL